ncbi:MAG TPA: hypothetical protein VE978_25760 [Chitinophagales bacterium]|nr:hypothetical protein [Chitinophagales bacterium]
MVLVIASILDEAAASLVNKFTRGAASLLTSMDLSRKDTDILFHQIEKGSIVASGKKIQLGNISGVLTLIPNIYPMELVQINKEDRSYVASEMNAFMLWFLSQLKCPVLNPPSPTCLNGQLWRLEYWMKLAQQQAIPTLSLKRSNTRSYTTNTLKNEDYARITVIGRKCIGTKNAVLQNYSLRLAEVTNLNLLQVGFKRNFDGEWKFAHASQFPDINDKKVAAAIIKFFSKKT